MESTPDKTTSKRYQTGRIPRDPRLTGPGANFRDTLKSMAAVDPITRELTRRMNAIVQDCNR
jgi:hypothetical protein